MKNIIYFLFLFSSTISYAQISTISATDGSILITPRGLLGKTNTSSTSNVALGTGALALNTTGNLNTANGYQALYSNTTGITNTANGYQALASNATGNYNTANGYQALYLNTTGSNNTANGNYALFSNTTGSNNTAIGYSANVSTGALTNATAIGANVTVNASNKVRIGNASVTVIEGQVAWSYPSDRRLKENISINNNLGLNFINRLQPVSYNYISDKTKVRHDGFIAQDIETILKELNLYFSGLKKSSDGMYSLAYSDFVMPLVNAVKEQQSIISDLVSKTVELVKKNDTNESQIQRLSSKNDTYESQILKLSSKLEEIEKRYPVGN